MSSSSSSATSLPLAILTIVLVLALLSPAITAAAAASNPTVLTDPSLSSADIAPSSMMSTSNEPAAASTASVNTPATDTAATDAELVARASVVERCSACQVVVKAGLAAAAEAVTGAPSEALSEEKSEAAAKAFRSVCAHLGGAQYATVGAGRATKFVPFVGFQPGHSYDNLSLGSESF
ncbi:uncharacterized protein AMSG_07669 [Thecamonas trahens ATCC 50062]|uniref:Saposin B-type domain-containing protein n=1 Tax=Thecamonas trahens ATCC 50062 TaxID=461836 RepID=A0A0L0DJJ4_THETB|nr:hypothetical protein AMSG_07669 [Thecamonas trahens ATCC 50062]KNC51473.1 hypothetical protein AMSG_07669 [Thecamonas trahens ATCC 50062]|eukprot:XP_013756135.1 hypothetical protein AMSG_07669 [Thecamonas trahens ATCC 50062]